MKQVRETKAAGQISAYVIISPKGEHVATVQAHFTDSGMCRVDVWGKHSLDYQGKAGGYGYDKFTAALAGAKIDGWQIFDHCGQDDQSKRILGESTVTGHDDQFIQSEIKALGMQFANYSDGHYKSLYYISGLDRLRAIGYNVIQAI